MAMSVPGAFANITVDCCGSDPDNYKKICEFEWGHLVKMSLEPGQKDHPHNHPVHYIYFLAGGNLKITAFTPDGPHEMALEPPTGACMPLPAGPHQVENVGETTVEALFLEVAEICQPCNLDGDFVSPFDVNPPTCYEKLCEDDKWFVAKMQLAVGETDTPHSHLAHLVYVLAGDQITIWPGSSAEGEGMVVNCAPGAALPVPAGHHIVRNTGTTDAQFLFWEVKM